MPKNKEIRVMLNYSDFVELTKGGVVEKEGVKIALEDIGYHNMLDIIRMNIGK